MDESVIDAASSRRPTRAFTLLLLAAASLGACASVSPPTPAAGSAAREPLVVFLVRHAEKVDSSSDPALSPAGAERAADLAAALADAGVERIHSSDYARTRDTASPLAAALGLEVEIYDPHDLPSLVALLRQAGGRHLVVGHSNTTPAAVELLGGQPASDIDEASEYDRLYVVTTGADGATGTVLLRYGRRSAPR